MKDQPTEPVKLRIDTPDDEPLRDLTEWEKFRIRTIALEVYAAHERQIALMDEAFKIIGLMSFADACGSPHEGQVENIMSWLYPDEASAFEYADSLLAWADSFQKGVNEHIDPK